MKYNKLISALGIALTLGSAHATYIAYSYVGNPYTSSTKPDRDGFRFTDRVTSSFVIDDSLWGRVLHFPQVMWDRRSLFPEESPVITLKSGPYELEYAAHIETDSVGRILWWSINGGGAGNFELDSRGFLDGSGFDSIMKVNEELSDATSVPPTLVYDHARVDYIVGDPSRPWMFSRHWTFAPVPDTGSSVILLGLALGTILLFQVSTTKQTNNAVKEVSVG